MNQLPFAGRKAPPAFSRGRGYPISQSYQVTPFLGSGGRALPPNLRTSSMGSPGRSFQAGVAPRTNRTFVNSMGIESPSRRRTPDKPPPQQQVQGKTRGKPSARPSSAGASIGGGGGGMGGGGGGGGGGGRGGTFSNLRSTGQRGSAYAPPSRPGAPSASSPSSPLGAGERVRPMSASAKTGYAKPIFYHEESGTDDWRWQCCTPAEGKTVDAARVKNTSRRPIIVPTSPREPPPSRPVSAGRAARTRQPVMVGAADPLGPSWVPFPLPSKEEVGDVEARIGKFHESVAAMSATAAEEEGGDEGGELAAEAGKEQGGDTDAPSLNAPHVDLGDSGVKSLVAFANGSPMLKRCNVAGRIQESGMREDELQQLRTARRERVRKDAQAALAQFDELAPEERQQAQDSGDIDLYSDENQAVREGLFEVHQEVNECLDDWWLAASEFLGKKDHGSAELDAKQYHSFHKRLLRLLHDPNEELNEDKAVASGMADFGAEVGEYGEVPREEFRYGVFRLTDIWACSLEASGYIDFLRSAYAIVFADLIEKDKLQAPKAWAPLMHGGVRVTQLPEKRVVEKIVEIYQDWSRVNKQEYARGEVRDRMDQFVVTMHETKHGRGTKSFFKHFRAFVGGLFACVDDHSSAHHSYCLLFAQLAGVQCASGRVASFSPQVTSYVVDRLDEMEPLLEDIKKHFPRLLALRGHGGYVSAFSMNDAHIATQARDQSVQLWDRESGDLLGEALVKHEPPVLSTLDRHGPEFGAITPEHQDRGKLTIATAGALVEGLVDADVARKSFDEELTETLNIPRDSPLYKASFVAFEALLSKRPLGPGYPEGAEIAVLSGLNYVALVGGAAHAKLDTAIDD